MTHYKIMHASEDWPGYLDMYNRHTRYAPYTLPLSMDRLQTYVLAPFDAKTQLILLGRGTAGQGLIHAGTYRHQSLDEGCEVGLIYLLLGDNNPIAACLLREAEDWFRQRKINHIRVCNWRPNPYTYILHGSETYLWGGFIAAINAYRRLGYDLVDESVVMMCPLTQLPEVVDPPIPDLTWAIQPVSDNPIVCRHDIIASIGGQQTGHCAYDDLRGLSQHLNKRIGQISIHVHSGQHGKGLGRALLMRAHRQLYQTGVRQVMLHTVQRLFRSIKLYEKVGYVEQNIRGFCMEKRLTPEETTLSYSPSCQRITNRECD
jgi:GNAT superfamily N-acetyltransferase